MKIDLDLVIRLVLIDTGLNCIFCLSDAELIDCIRTEDLTRVSGFVLFVLSPPLNRLVMDLLTRFLRVINDSVSCFMICWNKKPL